MKLIRTLIILIAASSCTHEATAQDLEQDGFADVARLLDAMTPQQRNAILQQAAIKEKDLQKLTPQHLASLRKQLRDIASTIDFDKIDPAKLDMAKASQSVDDTQNNLNTYQQKAQQGKISNAVMRPQPVSAGQ